MTLGMRIKKVVQHTGLSTPKFAERIEVQKQTVFNWIRGKNLSLENIIKILRHYPEINAKWLLIEEGSMLESSLPSSKENEDIAKEPGMEYRKKPITKEDLEVIFNECLKRVAEL